MANEVVRSGSRAQALVLFDGACAFCRQSVAWLKRLDWLGRLAYRDARDPGPLPETPTPLEPARLLEEMHLVTPDRGHVYTGFAAFRWIAARLPLLWLVTPVLYLPGVPWLGRRLYHWVARHRFRLVPCRTGQCAVPPRRK